MADRSPELVDLEPQITLVVRGDLPVAELPAFFADAFVAVATAAEAAGVEITGPPFSFYPEMPAETVLVEAGFPVSAAIEPVGDVHPLELPGGRAVVAMHVGPYEAMEKTYAGLQAWMAGQGLHPENHMWECHLSDPRTEPDPAGWRTRIVWPVS